MPFPAFALTITRLLRRLGYEEVTLCGVPHGRGRNSHGGMDIEASLTKGLARTRVICQLRQYDKEPVARQNVDVLRGAMLRVGADQGLLLTTSTFSPAAIEAAQAAQHAAPVRLIDGEELATLLLQHGLAEGTSDGSSTLSKLPEQSELEAVRARAQAVAARRAMDREKVNRGESGEYASPDARREHTGIPPRTRCPRHCFYDASPAGCPCVHICVTLSGAGGQEREAWGFPCKEQR